MGVFRSGTITYNPDMMDEAVLSAKKVTTNAGELKNGITGIVNSIPKGFSSSGISNANSVITGLDDKLSNLSSVLESMQEAMNESMNNDKIFNTLINSKYTELITLDNGQRGFLYVPKGYSSTAGLPLLVWLAGAGELGNSTRMKTTGLPYLIENGCEFDSVIWVPISAHPWSGDIASPDSNNKYYNKVLEMAKGDSTRVYNTMVSIEELVDKLKLDRNRINLYGYSNGAYGADKYAYQFNNYFSTVTAFGGAYTSGIPKDTSTTFIFINGTQDQGSSEADNAYSQIIANGNQAMIYRVAGATHSDDTEMINSALIHDILNIRKGQKLNTLVGGVQIVDRNTVLATSMMQNGNKKVENTWYKQLITGSATSVITSSIIDGIANNSNSTLAEIAEEYDQIVTQSGYDYSNNTEKDGQNSISDSTLSKSVEELKDVTQKSEDSVKEEPTNSVKEEPTNSEEKKVVEDKSATESSTESKQTTQVQTYVINDLRNKSVFARAYLTAEDVNNIIDSEVRGKKSVLVGTGEYWIKAGEETGLDPLFLLALARQESGLGTSNLAITRNNFFGMKYQNGVQYFGKITRDYASSVEEGIMKAAKWIKEFYVGQYHGDTTQKFGYTGYNGGNNYGDILTSIMGRMKDSYEGKTGKQLTFIK